MLMYDVIQKKKCKKPLSREEIFAFVDGYTKGEVPDYQAASLLMAISLCGMNDTETACLTEAIAKSGDTLDLSEFGQLSVDKHSTGGVGDKTTLIVAPIVAALGCKVAKMSGRGLGHTGGTVDKLEAIPGYNVNLSPKEFFENVRRVGVCIVGQTGNLTPADKKLYALRDVTATVDSIPLIASSVMGKKLAAGANSIVLDVKYGTGSFMKTPEEATKLAECAVRIGALAKRRVSALITNMDTPLGYAVGNALEVREAIETLMGKGAPDLTEICLELSAEMASLALDIDKSDAKRQAENAIRTGAAFEKFKEWIASQGGELEFIENPKLLKISEHKLDVLAESDGYISKTDSEKIGLSAVALGAGRKKKDDVIDAGAGIVLKKKTGDIIRCGDLIATLYSDSPEKLKEANEIFISSLEITKIKPTPVPLIYKIIKE